MYKSISPAIYKLRTLKREIIEFSRSNSPRKVLSALKFAFGGLDFNDKINSYYLKIALDRFDTEKPNSLLRKVKRSGNTIEIRHKRFHYLKLKYNLLDHYQMAICKEFFFENIYDLNKLSFVPDNIIDCGGFKGYFSILANKKFPTSAITCIEPHLENFNSIKESIEKNGLKNITLLNKAISKTSGPIKLYFAGTSGSVSGFHNEMEFQLVETIDIETLIDRNKSLLLKVDVEGAELEFFPYLIDKLPKKCFVFLETHDGWNSLQEIKKSFIQNGFKFEVTTERDIYIDSLAYRD
jgi:FkbM family methyltransferase